MTDEHQEGDSRRDEMDQAKDDAIRLCAEDDARAAEEGLVHLFGAKNWVCDTDSRGHAEPGDRSPLEIVVDATEGFIPLWAEDVTLRWRFNSRSMAQFQDPDGLEAYMRALLGEGLLLWEDAVPVRFTEVEDAWDFEIAVSPQEKCGLSGCTLARAFLPDGGQHDIQIYRTMFDQSVQEQIETMAHELGHVFGLRHFFARIHESRWPAEIFGSHSMFSIMNYGPNSVMTSEDISDLAALYTAVWSGDLLAINGTPIVPVKPFSSGRVPERDCLPAGATRRV